MAGKARLLAQTARFIAPTAQTSFSSLPSISSYYSVSLSVSDVTLALYFSIPITSSLPLRILVDPKTAELIDLPLYIFKHPHRSVHAARMKYKDVRQPTPPGLLVLPTTRADTISLLFPLSGCRVSSMAINHGSISPSATKPTIPTSCLSSTTLPPGQVPPRSTIPGLPLRTELSLSPWRHTQRR
jgi:hypothetical protein